MSSGVAYQDDLDVFDSAFAPDEPPTQDPSPPAPQDRPDTTPRADDDRALVSQAIQGLVRSRLEQQPQRQQPQQPTPQPQQTPAQPQPRADGDQHAVREGEPPLTPREIAFLNELREERRRRQELQQQQQPQQRPQGNQPDQLAADLETRLFENPAQVLGEIQQSLTQQFTQQLAAIRLESNIERAVERHGEENFKPAFEAFMQRVGNPEQPDPLTYERIMSSRSPGDEIMRWHREQSVLREVGEDPTSYRERLRQEILAELGQVAPAPQAQRPSVEAQQGQKAWDEAAPAPAQPQGDRPRDPETGQFRPRHELRLPTATSRLHGATAGGATDEDGSEEAIFEAGRVHRNNRK